jgi:glycosyltransferase involved in cell wall biosynthesis
MVEPSLISVVTPVYNPGSLHIRACIESVLEQDHCDWELCLVNDGSTKPWVAGLLDEYANADPRVRVHHRATNGGIVLASNDALAMARGDYVAFLDHDDVLTPDALSEVAKAIADHPDADVIYSDEDKLLAGGTLHDTFRKPDWSPEYLLGCMYLAHLCVYRRRLVEEVGRLREGFEGAQDWDLALRATARATSVHHIPKVLYHWRSSPGSTAAARSNKTYARAAGRRAVADHLARQEIDGWPEETEIPGWFRVRRKIIGEPLVSIIVPTAGRRRIVHGEPRDLILGCLQSVLSDTDYEHFEIVCVIEQGDDATGRRVNRLGDPRIRVVEAEGPFDFSHRTNVGAAHARGDHLVFLNDDIEVIAPEWMRLMLEFSQQQEIGAVGAKLLFEDGTIQHAGVINLEELPHHVSRGHLDGPGYGGSLLLNREYVAVTGACLMTRRDVFDEVGGLSRLYPLNYNDIDYCYKVVSRGYRIIVAMGAELYHYESSTRLPAVATDEMNLFRTHWGDRFNPDPYYSPAFTTPFFV